MSRYNVLRDEHSSNLDSTFQHLETIWLDIGLDDEQRNERGHTVIHHLGKLIEEIVAEEEALRSAIRKNVEEYSTKLHALCHELEINPASVAIGDDPDMRILQKEKQLKCTVAELRKMKQSRLREVEKLKTEDQTLCDCLCTTPYYIPSNTVPSATQISKLREHVADSYAEKEKRFAVFINGKKAIGELLRDLEKEPSTSFENDVLHESEEAFILSSFHIQRLQDIQEELEREKRDAEKTYTDLLNKIVSLWDRLDVQQQHRQQFIDANIGYTHKTITNLRGEHKRLEELKLQNMQKFIEVIRLELVDLWNKCFYSAEQRSTFTPFTNETYTEEMLSDHEREVQRLKTLYTSAEDIYRKVGHRQTIFAKIKEFERGKTSDDPNRFNNRGGRLNQLLKADQKMKKELPIIEKELGHATDAWETSHGQAFLIEGVRYDEFIQREWANWTDEQGEAKRTRQQLKQKITVQEMTFGSKPCTPVKRRFGVFSTPQKQPSAKVRKLDKVDIPKIKTPKIRRSRRLATGGPRRILRDHNTTARSNTSHLSHSSVISEGRSCPNMSLASAGSYNEFAVCDVLSSTKNGLLY